MKESELISINTTIKTVDAASTKQSNNLLNARVPDRKLINLKRNST